LENDQDGDQSGSETPEPDVTKRRFRLRRKKGGKGRHKTRREKKKEQGDIEKGEVLQDADKRGVGGFGLSSKEQITPADAVLAEESANEVRRVFFYSRHIESRHVVRSFCRSWTPQSCLWGSSPLKTCSKVCIRRDIISHGY